MCAFPPPFVTNLRDPSAATSENAENSADGFGPTGSWPNLFLSSENFSFFEDDFSTAFIAGVGHFADLAESEPVQETWLDDPFQFHGGPALDIGSGSFEDGSQVASSASLSSSPLPYPPPPESS